VSLLRIATNFLSPDVAAATVQAVRHNGSRGSNGIDSWLPRQAGGLALQEILLRIPSASLCMPLEGFHAFSLLLPRVSRRGFYPDGSVANNIHRCVCSLIGGANASRGDDVCLVWVFPDSGSAVFHGRHSAGREAMHIWFGLRSEECRLGRSVVQGALEHHCDSGVCRIVSYRCIRGKPSCGEQTR
jgi:hypothetical protein